MFCGGEAKLGLENTQFVQVDIYQGFLQLGEAQFCRLDSISVGYVYKINLGHLSILRDDLARIGLLKT